MAKTINVTGNVNGVGLGVQTVPDALANELVNRRLATFLSAEVQPTLGSPDGSTSGGVASTARLLVSAYESQQALQNSTGGPRLYPKPGLPLAADIPVITMSLTDPAVDVDAAQQMITTFDTSVSVDPIPLDAKLKLKRSGWLRNFSEALRARKTGVSVIAPTSLQLFNNQGNCLTELGDGTTPIGYGLYGGACVSEFTLDDDVFFMNQQGGALVSNFELYVKEAMVTAAPGDTNLTLTGGRSYQCNINGFVKFKFPTVAKRKIKLTFSGPRVPTSFRFRKIATAIPTVPAPLRWMHFGDSFSVRTDASSASLGFDRWMLESFGDCFDFINAATGGSGFCNGGSVLVGQTPVSGNGSSYRFNFRRHAGTLAPYNIISALVGCNDATGYRESVGAQAKTDYLALLATECRATLSEMIAHSPGALIFIAASNTGNAGINDGSAIVIENAVKAVCAEFPNVIFIPLQTWEVGPFLRGTGNALAPTGDGNMDRLSNGLHQPDAGHQALGEMLARRVYEIAKTKV